MALIRPFRALRPKPEFAEQVAAPPYDVVNTEEARTLAEDRPWSFLHISRPEIDLPSGTDPYSPQVYAKGKENFSRMLSQQVLVRDNKEGYYLYRLHMGDHQQTGLVAIASVQAYQDNLIRKHEFTRPDKEDDRVKQIDSLNAQTGPVFLTYRHHKELDDYMARLTSTEPQVDIRRDDGVRHCLWVVDEQEKIAALDAYFRNDVECLYIADGHHRSAAAARVAQQRRKPGATASTSLSHEYFLAVLFPHHQVKILDYNRVVADLNGLSLEKFLLAVEDKFSLNAVQQAYKPKQSGEFGMYVAGQWYALQVRDRQETNPDPVARLDISLLSEQLIAPILGIQDPRRDKRIDFVGGIRGLQALALRVDSGDMAVAFALYPTSLSDLMAVADAGKVMPPKSTWFEPKLADGLVTHVLD